MATTTTPANDLSTPLTTTWMGDDNGSKYSWHSALTQQESSDQEDDGIQALGILPVEMPNPDSHPFSSLIFPILSSLCFLPLPL
ncbi:hypothetical protein THAR02_04941 [Trichoderma harzianum]|uniref:Uncharacterized protein n=1 Tax=Trichoderma harzianum TaxID=5544 RepID=A0A0G0AD58_TRIHA|nr:hypothetical protein THAR02_04941 [Trichoderma harzianum]